MMAARLPLLLLLFSLSGCGYLFGDEGVFRDTSGDYVTAPEHDPIELPPGLRSDRIDECRRPPERGIDDDRARVACQLDEQVVVGRALGRLGVPAAAAGRSERHDARRRRTGGEVDAEHVHDEECGRSPRHRHG